MSIGFSRSMYDNRVYIRKRDGSVTTYLLLYVDDMLVASMSLAEVEQVKHDLRLKFDMKDLGCAKRILGMDIPRFRDKCIMCLTQNSYIQKVLKFRMHEAKAVSVPLSQHFKLSEQQKPASSKEEMDMNMVPYANAVGSVMYTMVCTRPDLAHAINVASRFMSNPSKYHWEALKWILRYLRGSSNMLV